MYFNDFIYKFEITANIIFRPARTNTYNVLA